MALLHQAVPPSRWCVTRQDLRYLRCEIEKSILDKRIRPTELDNFDPEDRKYGPSMYTVCEQYIKPVTAEAGNMSWALMLHPEGLECDVFISHAWQEGFFELVDKVLTGWPRGARHAYCCVLANPQNLDICSLISNPIDSPFARALQSAKWVLVVPNRNCSIYSRIWRCYEVYLSYTWGKHIFTASSPSRGLWRRVVPLASFYISTMLLCLVLNSAQIINISWIFLSDGVLIRRYLTVISCLSVIISVSVNVNIVAHVMNYVALACYAVDHAMVFSSAYADWKLFVDKHGSGLYIADYAIETVAFFITCALSEVDCVLRTVERRESRALSFSGHVMDATCSVQRDGDRIKKEIRDSGEEEAVDRAIHILIKAGMSTPDLQAVDFHVNTRGFAHCTYSMLFLGMLAWLHTSFWYMLPNGYKGTGNRGTFRLSGACAFFQGCLFAIALLCMPRDRQHFAAYVARFFIFPWLLLLVCSISVEILAPTPNIYFYESNRVLYAILAFFSAPMTLVLSSMGVAAVSRIPGFGVTLTNLILRGRCNVELLGLQNLSRRSSDSNEVELVSICFVGKNRSR